MITINNVANTWLIPSYNRNAVSTYLLNELIKDDFEIEVSVKTDWDKFKKSKQKYAGVVVLNGLHFGIICKVDDLGGRLIAGEVWTEVNGKNYNEVIQVELDHNDKDTDWRDIKFDFDFKRKTRYKIYDESGNGNHLMKKFINEKGHVMVF